MGFWGEKRKKKFFPLAQFPFSGRKKEKTGFIELPTSLPKRDQGKKRGKRGQYFWLRLGI